MEPDSCTPLWPKSELEDKLLKLRVKGTEEISAPFLITESHTTLLKLKNRVKIVYFSYTSTSIQFLIRFWIIQILLQLKIILKSKSNLKLKIFFFQYGGINVDIQITEGSIFISLTNYRPGFAPAMIVNHTGDTLRLWEKESVTLRKLEPYHCVYYTWDNPSGQRTLVWDIGNGKDMEDDLRRDDIGEFYPTENQVVYWTSFLNGMQRVLLFTESLEVANEAQSAKHLDEQQQEINISINGIGLSLVNNVLSQEVMYMGISSSGVIWEQSKSMKKRYKQINPKDSHLIEMAYQQFLFHSRVPTEDFGRMIVDDKIEVDFENNIMLKPHKRFIRRTFEVGLWMQMMSSSHLMQVHAKINRIQIDNQIFDCLFPVVLAPVPPPKSVAANFCKPFFDSLLHFKIVYFKVLHFNSLCVCFNFIFNFLRFNLNFIHLSFVDHKPFAELSIVQLLVKNSQIRQYKYFKLLVQEFHVKIDLGFVNAFMECITTAELTPDEEVCKETFINYSKPI